MMAAFMSLLILHGKLITITVLFTLAVFFFYLHAVLLISFKRYNKLKAYRSHGIFDYRGKSFIY